MVHRLGFGALLTGAFAVANAQTPFRVYDSQPAPAASISAVGGATVSANPITKLIAEDVTPMAGYAGQSITSVGFVYNNALTYPATFRAAIRLWNANGVNSPLSGLPGVGTYLSLGSPKGYVSGPISLAAQAMMATDFTIPSGDLPLPASRFWVGVQLDNDSNGLLYSDPAELNQLSLAVGTPVVGSTGTGQFKTITGYDCFGINAPSGIYEPAELALWIGVAGQDFDGVIALQDVVAELAVDRTLTVSAFSGATLITSKLVTMSQASSTQSFTITLPATLPFALTNPVRFEVDGSSFLKRTINGSLPVPPSVNPVAITLGSINLQNGDVDGSGEVDAADIDEVIAAFGDVSAADTDVDVSGEVDAADIDIVIANFGAVDE